MALTEWGFNGLPPQWSLQSPGCIQWSWPIKMSKNDKFTFILLMPITNVQMALKYTPVAYLKLFLSNLKLYDFGPWTW